MPVMMGRWADRLPACDRGAAAPGLRAGPGRPGEILATAAPATTRRGSTAPGTRPRSRRCRGARHRARHRARHTRDLDDVAARLAAACSKTAACELMRTGWRPGAVQQRVHPPVARPDAGHGCQDVRAPPDRNVVHHQQEHAPGLEVQPVGHRTRRFRRGVRDMDPAAGARHLVPVMLDGHRPRPGQVGDLMGVPRPQAGRVRQVAAALAGALREMRDRLVRILAPGRVCARPPRCWWRTG
jgi:hypothetical protein